LLVTRPGQCSLSVTRPVQPAGTGARGRGALGGSAGDASEDPPGGIHPPLPAPTPASESSPPCTRGSPPAGSPTGEVQLEERVAPDHERLQPRAARDVQRLELGAVQQRLRRARHIQPVTRRPPLRRAHGSAAWHVPPLLALQPRPPPGRAAHLGEALAAAQVQAGDAGGLQQQVVERAAAGQLQVLQLGAAGHGRQHHPAPRPAKGHGRPHQEVPAAAVAPGGPWVASGSAASSAAAAEAEAEAAAGPAQLLLPLQLAMRLSRAGAGARRQLNCPTERLP
jgi:hypothetical protein